MESKLGNLDTARQKLKAKMSFEYFKSKDKFKSITKEEQEELFENIERFTFLILDVYFEENPDEMP